MQIFPVSGRIEKKINVCMIVFSYENEWAYPVHVSDQTFEKCMDLLLITDKKISRTMSILKILADLCVTRQKIRIKNTFADIVYKVLVVKKSCKNIKFFS